MSVLHQATDVAESPTRVARTPRPAWTVAALLGADVAALAVAALAAAIGAAFDPTTLLRCLPFVLVAPIALAIAGLYPGAGLGPVAEYRRLSGALLVATVVSSGTVALAWGFDGSAVALLTCLALALVIVPAGRALVREGCARRRWWGVPVVVVGDARSASVAIEQLFANPRLGLKPVARALDDTSEGPWHVQGVPVADRTATDRRARPKLLILPGASRRSTAVRAEAGVPGDVAFIAPADLRSLGLTGARPTRLDRAFATQAVPTVRPRRVQGLVKRSIDMLLALPFAVAAAPLIALAALAVIIASPGTPFFYQVRAGLRGRPIRVWKLRTMYVDAGERLARHLGDDPAAQLEWSRSFKLTRDPRILPVVGRFLRASSIDELPQVFNVLLGDMSFVGPRPFPEYHLAAFDDEFRQLRTTVRPGITGLWQVTARSDGDLDVQRALDTAYIRNWSLGLDLYLLLRTPLAVLSARGAR